MNSKTDSVRKFRQVKESDFFIDFARITGALPALLVTMPKVYYAADKKKSLVRGGVLIASNHVSLRDPMLLYWVFWRRRLRFLATKDLYKNQLLAFLFSAAGCIQVDKENVRTDMLRQVVDRLKKGKAVLIFPEGQVNLNATQTGDFKSGAVLMAKLAGVPIQPVHIVCPKKGFRRHVAIVGEPIDVSSMCSRFPSVEELEKVSSFLRQREQELEKFYIAHVLKEKKG